MYKKIFSIFIFAILAICCTYAQSTKAAQIIDKAKVQFEKSGGITADFDIAMTQKGKSVGSTSGNLKMKGRKFCFVTDEVIIWYDGKNQWVMNNGNDEVSLSNPTDDEMDVINPSVLFSTYQKEYTTKYIGAKTIVGKVLETVELTPKKSQTDIAKITLQLDQKSYTPAVISIQTKSGAAQKIQIRNYKSGINLSDAAFSFNPKQYPKAEVIDLR